MKHLKFGRIIGMSTRRGSTIFLDDVLNEAKERALSAIKSSPSKFSIFCKPKFANFSLQTQRSHLMNMSLLPIS